MRSRVLWALCLVSLLCAWPAMAQEQTGSIQGVVKDSSGGVLPGVTVEARSATVVGASTAVTDERGVYRFPALPPGTYVVTADLSGFTPAKMANVALSLGQLLTVDLTLSIGTLQESVQVTAEAPLIDTKQNAAFANIQKDVIDRIPKGRDFASVVKQAPGAQDETRSGGLQIDGSSGSENRFIIDGMDTTNMQTGVQGKTMLLDFVQEVQVKSSGYNAEFGGALGGVISAITKSGSNAFRGSIGTYYQSDKFYGEQRQISRYHPNNIMLFEQGLKNTTTPWTYWSPIGELGGPVLKDRIWFYVGAGYTRNDYQRDATFYADKTNTVRHFEYGNWTVYPNYNLTAQVTNNLRVKLSGAQQRYRSRGTAPTLQPEGSFMPDGRPSAGISTSTFDTDQTKYNERWNFSGEDTTNDTWSANVDWVLTPTFFVNATGGYYRTNRTTPAEFRGTSVRHIFNNAPTDAYMAGNGYPTVPSQYFQLGGYTDNKSSNGTERDINERLFFNANTIWYKNMGGQHVIKAGMRFERFGNDVLTGRTKPEITIYWGQPFSGLDGSVMTGKYGYFTLNQIATMGKVHSNNYSIWLQDSWTINNRLTINAGVRAETEHIPSYKKTEDAVEIKFGLKDKIAPRIGFAYDIKGDGKWKTYGSYGWFYDITKLELPRGQWGGDHWIDWSWGLDTPDWASIDCGEGTTSCSAYGKFFEQWDARRSTNQYDPLLSEYFGREMTGVDPDLKPVRTGEFTLGMDHELNATMSIGARYVHKWIDRTIEDIGVLFPGIGEVYIHGNPGFGITEVMIPDFPQYTTPKATRKYDALEIRLKKRLANRWSGDVSYTLSRLWGNYSGLASSDEPNADGAGRNSPNVNRYYDALYMSYDKNQEQVFGRLASDRPHVLKASATYDTPWGTSVGLFGTVMSGMPVTEEFTFLGYPVYANGRGNLGRTPVFSQTDLQLAHDFRLGRTRLTLLANVDNLFDQKTWFQPFAYRQWRNSTNLGDEDFFGGPWQPEQLVQQARANGATIRDEQGFMVPNVFQGRRSARIQAKLSF